MREREREQKERQESGRGEGKVPIYSLSSGVRNTKAFPDLPIRAVRPILCTKAAGFCGASYLPSIKNK